MRKGACKLIRSIARLRSRLEVERAELGRRLAARPAASGVVVASGSSGESSIYGSLFDHLDAELGVAKTELTAVETAYVVGREDMVTLRRKLELVTSDLYDLHASIERFCHSQPRLKKRLASSTARRKIRTL